ncbi:MAG: Gfo/Idh/MocA family protein, partial [Thermocrispum sp.]
GDVRHVRAQYLQDWLTDPREPLSWRLQAERAGSGALGDIGAHIVDLTQHITGEPITGVSATTSTFVPERPLPEPNGHRTGKVTVDDAVAFLARFTGGGLGTFEATRFATGRKNAIRIEINGSAGSLAFDFEEMNVLHFYDGSDPGESGGFTRILVTEPDHPYVGAWWPPGHLLGYEHGFANQAADLLNAIADGVDPEPSFADGLAVQRVLAAVQDSAAGSSAWTPVDRPAEVA